MRPRARPVRDAILVLVTLAGAALRAQPPASLVPPSNLHAEGIPPIPLSLVEQVRPYTEFRSASFRSWHPERREMLIATRFGETEQIHSVIQPGGARRQLTFWSEPVGAASYDPRDGRSFVVARDVGGDEFFQLYRHDLATGSSTLLTDGRRRHALGPWSNAGDLLAYTLVDADERGARTEIWVVDPRRPESRRRAASLPGGGWAVEDWSPDDRRLLLVERVAESSSALWLLELRLRSTPRRLTPEPAAGKSSWRGGRFSADGRVVFASTDAHSEWRQLAALRLGADGSLEGDPEIWSADIPWDVSAIELSERGDLLAFLTNEGGWSRLYLLDVVTRGRRAIETLPDGVASGLRWHGNGRDLALSVSSARSSGDVWVIDAASGGAERWTESETGGLDPARFVEPSEIAWTSFDGKRITGLLYQPDARRFPGRRPVIVDIHGGPEGQERPGFRDTDNLFVSELGIAVVYPNVRGSTGYGKTFVDLDNGLAREGSYEDVRTLLEWIPTHPQLDADRVMVTGGSYGGHMTFAAATRFGDRLCCSAPVVGISNLRTFLENTQGYRRDLRRVEYGDERDPRMREFLERIAPLNHAKNIRKPILVVHGRNDPRVPWTESQQIVEAVRANGVEAWYLLAEDEGHGFKKKGNRAFQLYATVAFVKRFLLKEGGAIAPADSPGR